jgi:hypothetical protein
LLPSPLGISGSAIQLFSSSSASAVFTSFYMYKLLASLYHKQDGKLQDLVFFHGILFLLDLVLLAALAFRVEGRTNLNYHNLIIG